MNQRDNTIEETALSLKEVGARIKLVRTKLLKLSQEELATEINSAQNLNTNQTLISRLETEGRCSADLFLAIVNYINGLGYRGYLLLTPLFPVFDVEMLNSKMPLGIEQIVELLKLNLKDTQKNLGEVIARLDIL